jgi:hypothetical protein
MGVVRDVLGEPRLTLAAALVFSYQSILPAILSFCCLPAVSHNQVIRQVIRVKACLEEKGSLFSGKFWYLVSSMAFLWNALIVELDTKPFQRTTYHPIHGLNTVFVQTI